MHKILIYEIKKIYFTTPHKTRILIYFLFLFSLSSCSRNLLDAVDHPERSITVNIFGFIGDCQVGNRSSGSDISYTGQIIVKVNSGGTLKTFNEQDFTSPATDNKDPYDILNVKVPSDVSFEITVFIDGKECSLCDKALCNPKIEEVVENGQKVEYQIDNGYAYWSAWNNIYQSDLASNRISLRAVRDARTPGIQASCPCRIKL